MKISRLAVRFAGLAVAAHVAVAAAQSALVYRNKDGIAVDGYDVVGYFKAGRALRGDAAHQAVHNGYTYRFATAENLAAFRASPETYLPQFGGYCVLALALASDPKVMLVDPTPTIWRMHEGKLYLSCVSDELTTDLLLLKKDAFYSDARWNWRNKLKQP